MMLSPEGFRDMHQDDSYKELLAVKEELLEEIAEFELNPEESGPFLFPSPSDVYLFNLQYLAILCELLEEKYILDIRNGQQEDLDPEEME